MKNKDGFTLVELLAVIAILAILVIIALPNVINMYNRAQKQTFLTEAKKVYSESEKKYLTNAISGKKTKIINSEDSSKLDMTGKKLQYCVILNNSGKVTDMKVSNGKWIASLNGKAIDELTIDDLEDGNLDDYECVKVTDESCFTYDVVAENEENATAIVTVEDANKCKTYLMSDSVGAPEDMATTLCNGVLYKSDDSAYTIQDIALDEFSAEEVKNAGLSIKYVTIEKVEVVDTAKCKNHIQSKFNFEDSDVTTLCTTNESVYGTNLFQAVSDGYISFLSYDESGLKVTTRPLSATITITGYDTNCGTDVVIPSKINGYNVTNIDNYAFEACYREVSSEIANDEYKVKFLDYKNNYEYSIEKVDRACNTKRLTSVVLPDTLIYIGDYAFTYNDLTEVTIPSSVGHIGSVTFAYNKIKTVTYEGDESNIKFGNCSFDRNPDYPYQKKYCIYK